MSVFANKCADRERLPEVPSDAALVLAARGGDKGAFVEIVARHQALVCGVAFGLLTDFAAGEDVAQEAFLTAWKRLGDLREPEKLRSWLSQIARNAALGALRRRRDTEPLDQSSEYEADSPAPDQLAATEDEAALVRSALAKLPESYRLPLVLFYCDSQSVRDVASALDLSEDAVKQRLARGREMLRERMSSLVEDVLGRSRPSAVFTMTVAAALGALAAPAVVAGAAFTGSSTAITTATTTETIIAAMSTSKVMWSTAAAVALLCIPLGYNYAPGTARPAPEESARLSATADAGPPVESALFAEWRALHEAHGTNAAAMPLIFGAITEMNDPVRRRAFEMALAAEWAGVDPASGFAFFSEKNSALRSQLFENWLAVDAPAAIDHLLAGKDWHSLAREVLSDIARKAPDRLVEVASKLPKSNNFWNTSVLDAFTILAESHLQNARLHAEAVTGPNRDQALSGIARVWAAADLDAAIKWADGLPDDVDRTEIKRVALIGKASVDPIAALDRLDLVPPGGQHGYFATTTGARVLREAAVADFHATVQWMARHPGRLGHEDIMGLAEEVTRRLNADPTGFLNSYGDAAALTAIAPAINSALLNESGPQRRAVWEWLRTQDENEGVRQVRASVLSSAAYQAPEVALEFAADLPAGEKGVEKRREIAQNLLSNGQMMHRFDHLYEKAPSSMRPLLMEAAFASLSGGRADDLGKWIDLLPLLPEEARSKGVTQIASAWAERSPTQALDWVSSLPPSDRGRAMSGVVSQWVYKDFKSAAQWVGTLPPGHEREETVHSLVNAASQDHPREAWDWALTLTHPQARQEAAVQLVNQIARRDAAQARQWIQSGPFDESTRGKMLASLQVFTPANGGNHE